MAKQNQDMSQTRRGILAGAGVVAAASVLPNAGHSAAPPMPCGAPPPPDIVATEYWANKGNVRLNLWRKRLANAPRGQRVLFLVHGSSTSGRSSYDLATPGLGEYSVMNVFARLGYDVWTMDFEGYGRSTVTAGNSDIKSGVQDLLAATEVVARETGLQKFHFLGQSSGSLRAGAFAMERPERVDRMILGALTYTGRGSPTLTERAEQTEFYRNNNRRPRGRAQIDNIFTRDRPGTSDMRLAAVLAEAELRYGDTVPTGTYLDMVINLPVVDPKRINVPVLVVRGQYDGIATEEDLLDFYRQLPNADRQFAILPGIAHQLYLSINREVFWHTAHAFLNVPALRPV
jgi:pimeloyl-ACP methyl ester carboxylesterase